jgi:hypothetical protein
MFILSLDKNMTVSTALLTRLQTSTYFVSLTTLTSLQAINVSIFPDIVPCSLYLDHCFGGIYYLHLEFKNNPSQKPERYRF